MLIAILVAAVPVVLSTVLTLWLWRYRKDCARRGWDIASLYDGTYRAREILSEALYTTEGRRLLPWVRASVVLVVLGFLVGLVLISRTM
jgi:hypothetical protein